MSSDGDLINPADFRSLAFEVSLHNDTTNTALQEGKRVYGKKRSDRSDEDLSIRVLELAPTGMVLEVPQSSCSRGHRIQIKLSTLNAPERIEIEALAQVEQWERMENGKERIEVRFLRHDSKLWSDLLAVFSARQQEILDFFHAVKGD
ncbi:MAG: hypothetical protein IT285_11805 [Bdellovibrionales bacterium]|nr:hypothetical protein [Bdellovibrionales bacterium]